MYEGWSGEEDPGEAKKEWLKDRSKRAKARGLAAGVVTEAQGRQCFKKSGGCASHSQMTALSALQ